ncbi:MAG: 4Fe-4S binding protein [Oscillospiraceae bacterium]|nr:4Fe-4S binding protein [Oscillospiraceae bacterium]
MPRFISDDCLCCGSCAAVCPCEAISMGDEHYEVDPDQCVDCGACENECPVGAIGEAEE